MRDAFEQAWLEKFSQAAKTKETNRDQSLFIEGNPYYREYFLEYADAALGHGSLGSRVLDIGCGTGSTLRVLAERGFQVYGVDFSPEIIQSAKEKAGQNRLSLHLEVADIYQLPFPNGFFDVVICNYLLQTVSDPEKVLQEAFRVLKPGGRMFVITLNALSVGRALLRDNLKFYRPLRFKKMMKRLGFRVCDLRGIYFLPKSLDWITRLILFFRMHRLFNMMFFPLFIFFAHSFYIEAQKP